MTSSSALISASLAFAVVAAVLGAYGFHGRAVVVGIDLGTTFSAVAVAKNRSGTVVRTGPNGEKSTASILAVHDGHFVVGETARQFVTDEPWRAVFDAKRVIGRSLADPVALAEAARHGGRLVPHPNVMRNAAGKLVPQAKIGTSCKSAAARCVHDLAFVIRVPPDEAGGLGGLGSHKCVDPGSVTTAAQLVTFLKNQGYSSSERNSVSKIEDSGSESDSEKGNDGAELVISPELLAARGDERLLLITPQAAGCVIIRHMVESVRRALGHATIASVVAAVPADFNQGQREATSDAYRRAGVTVSRMLSEPAAAAVAYGLHRRPDVRYVVVFDMGGGTTDVSVLYAQEGAFTVIGSAGDGHLGGEDFDDCVMGIMGGQLIERGISVDDTLQLAAADIASSAESTSSDASGDEQQQQQRVKQQRQRRSGGGALPLQHGSCSGSFLKHEAERVKIELSSDGHEAAAAWNCTGSLTADIKRTQLVQGIVTRQAFQRSCAHLFDRALGPITEALDHANLEVGEVNELVLVGGSSRLPLVREKLMDHFKRHRLLHTVDPDLAVAIGAASVVD